MKSDALSEEQKLEVIQRGQEIVSKTQVRDLHQVFPLLDKVLEDKQKTYYIVLDGLDENWVEEKLKYKLIMGLVQTAREFIQVRNAKVVIALRRDLLGRVFRLTRDSGFQEEKYRGLYLELAWTRDSILEILDKRVRLLVRRRYTKKSVSYLDLLPPKHNDQSIREFIFDIARQPRDIVAFFNSCISAAVDKDRISTAELTKAVGDYSRQRLRALGDEWHNDYPALLDFAEILQSRPPSFKVDTISREAIEELCLDIVASNPNGRGLLLESASSLIDGVVDDVDFRKTLLLVFYRVGLVGLKTHPEFSASWSDGLTEDITRGQLDDSTSVVIAKKYAVALGVRL